MSDRVTNAEVEDVLSSIRRLVSEDSRPRAATLATAVAPAAERLVLTPALRVSEPEALLQKPGEIDIPAEFTDGGAPTDDGLGVDQAKADDGANAASGVLELTTKIGTAEAKEASNDPFGSENKATSPDELDTTPILLGSDNGTGTQLNATPTVDVVVEDVNPTVEAETAFQTDPLEAPAKAEATGADEVSETAPMVTTSAKGGVLTAKIAALETAIGKISGTWEPDSAGESDYAGTRPEVMAWEDDTIDEAEPSPFAKPMLAPVMRKVSEDAEADASVTDVAADDASVAQPFMTQRKQSAAEDAELSDEVEVLDEAEALSVDGATSAETETMVDEPIGAGEINADLDDEDSAAEAGLLGEDQVLDEEALRELISQVVRTELQGALGERITRNVRKLVRREVNRALTAQELE